MTTESSSYADFKQVYLEEFTNLSTREKGRQFAKTLAEDFYDLPDSADWYYRDGPGDGGIDIAILDRQGEEEEGDTWYLIQSKYSQPSLSQLRIEAKKIVDVLEDKHNNLLSNTGEDTAQRLKYFLKNSSDKDRLIIVFATPDPIKQNDLDSIRHLIQRTFSLSLHFDVQNISIKSIYDKNLSTKAPNISLSLRGHFQTFRKSQLNSNLLVGTVTLKDLYHFLKEYQKGTNNLDLIYEYNIRQYLGNQKKVNKKIQETLEEQPMRFGLYNNGITFVVVHYIKKSGTLKLTNPYIINGCQTTRSIFDVLDRKLDSGGTAEKSSDQKLENWKRAIKESSIIIKIIEVAQSDLDPNLIPNITRYTNTQTAIVKADFNSLNKKIHLIQKQFNDQYSEEEVYLELHRGGWEAEKKHRQNQGLPKLPRHRVKIDELLKIYGSGWWKQPGVMLYDAQSIRPGGTIYGRLFEHGENKFGHEDFYAAHLLKAAFPSQKDSIKEKSNTKESNTKESNTKESNTKESNTKESNTKESNTKESNTKESNTKAKEIGKMQHLYYFVVMELLRYVLKHTPNEDKNITEEERDTNERQALTKALIKIFKNKKVKDRLLDIANRAIIRYLDESNDLSMYKEVRYVQSKDKTLFLRGKSLGQDPNFKQILLNMQTFMTYEESGPVLDKMLEVLEREDERE